MALLCGLDPNYCVRSMPGKARPSAKKRPLQKLHPQDGETSASLTRSTSCSSVSPPWARAPTSRWRAPALLKGDLGGIVRARRLSQATMRNIRQNLFFAFIYNAAGIPIAAGVLYPTFGLLLSPIIAGAAMALSSVSVVGNALRLRSARL